MPLLSMLAQAAAPVSASDVTWIAVAMTGVSMLTNVATGLLALGSLFINKKYDAELNKVKQDLAHCESRHAENEKEREREREEKDEMRAELAAVRAKVELMEARARRRHPEDADDTPPAAPPRRTGDADAAD